MVRMSKRRQCMITNFISGIEFKSLVVIKMRASVYMCQTQSPHTIFAMKLNKHLKNTH